jgi:sodium-dependent dicarboxylate transporter 2/3/5
MFNTTHLRHPSGKIVGLMGGPLTFILIRSFFYPEGLVPEANAVLATAVWMAIWWISEAIPIAVTALLPIVLFPATGALSLIETTHSFGHRILFLFLGGFMLAIAMEHWNLHKRIALRIIRFIGINERSIIMGFMAAVAFLSMWISNTATTIMMLPVAAAVIAQLNHSKPLPPEELPFSKALTLSIAYAASIGGMATLIGTPPNLIFAAIVQDTYGVDISFFQWFKFGLPVSVLLLVICWFYLVRIKFPIGRHPMPGGKEEIDRQFKELGKISYEEKAVLVVFLLAAFSWITRSYLLVKFIPALDDSMIAVIAAIALFIIPSKTVRGRLLDWETAVKLPWGIILLFGGGLALASGFTGSGLSQWLGERFGTVAGLPLWAIVFLLIFCVNFLTEITSNLATVSMMLPVLAALAESAGLDPYTLMVAATVAASCAFMLPVATAPNAIVFGSGYITMKDMVKTGLLLNLISILVLTLAVNFFLGLVW